MPNQMEILAYINIKRKHNTSKDNSFPIISIAFAKEIHFVDILMI